MKCYQEWHTEIWGWGWNNLNAMLTTEPPVWAASAPHQVTLHPPVLISYEIFPRFLFQNDSSGGAVPGKGRWNSFFKHIGESSSSPSAGFANQFSIYLWQGRKARVFASLSFSTFAFLPAGRCRLCSDSGLSSRVQVWKIPFLLAKSIVWKLLLLRCCSYNCWVYWCPKQMSE